MSNRKSDSSVVTATVTLVDIGYQIDLEVDGKPMGSSCRDFCGDYPPSEMAVVVCGGFIAAMENAERVIKKLRKERSDAIAK